MKKVDIFTILLQCAQRLPFFGKGEGQKRILPIAASALLLCAASIIATSILRGKDEMATSVENILLVPQLGFAVTTLLLVIVGLVTVGLVAIAIAYLIIALRKNRLLYLARNSPPWRIIFLIVIGMLIFYFIVALVLSLIMVPEEQEQRLTPLERGGEATEPEITETTEPEYLETQPTSATSARRSRTILMTVLTIGFLSLIYFAIRLMRTTEANAPNEGIIPEKLRQELVEAAKLAISDLQTDPDFRRAVIGCWAYLETALKNHKYPRPRHYTPLEYVRSLVSELPQLPASSLLEFTGLYEIARFSEHPVTYSDRDVALHNVQEIHRILSTV